MPARTLRLLALLLPSPIAVLIALPDADRHLVTGIAIAIGVLGIAVAAVLVARLIAGHRADRAGSPASRIDLLTSNGAAVMCAATVALLAAQPIGWASLAVVGTLGIGAVYVAVIWTALTACGERPWRHATVERAVVPDHAVEGDPLREEIRLAGVIIPPGMRLFVLGQPMRRGPSSRHAVESDASRAQIELVSELGPAVRGNHRAPPLSLWLGDVLGLARTPVVHRGEAAFTVVPRLDPIDHVERLLGLGGDDVATVPAQRLPTEGSFRIREYTPGDDARRIHWVRSLQQQQLVVRLPDEIAAAEPAVHVILDDELAGTEALTCRAPDELLDGLVRVWLGLGVALAATGVRVTLVTAVEQDGAIRRVERVVTARARREALQLGARVAWQAHVPLEALLAGAPIDRAPGPKQLVVSSRPRRLQPSGTTWVVVPVLAWTAPEPPLHDDRSMRLPFPSGSAENRRRRRAQEHARITTSWTDRAVFSHLTCWSDLATLSGSHVARPKAGRVTLTVIP